MVLSPQISHQNGGFLRQQSVFLIFRPDRVKRPGLSWPTIKKITKTKHMKYFPSVMNKWLGETWCAKCGTTEIQGNAISKILYLAAQATLSAE